jgi:oxygen-independent coproporphyrinogen-3 oxidase
VSLGVQSLDDAELSMLGRAHDASRALEAAAEVLHARLDLSLDLMCGLPGQSASSWRTTLTRAIETGANHVSVYPLSIEENTPLGASVRAGGVPEPDPDRAADMLEDAAGMLGQAGLARYEVANYARPGHESRHNSAYWTGRAYLGVGPGAHGMLDADTARSAGVLVPEGTTRVRYAVTEDLETGLVLMPKITLDVLAEAEAAREDVMLGLRLTRGVLEELVGRAGLHDVMTSLEQDGLVARTPGGWATTDRGWLLGNEVFGRVWAGR